MNLHTLHIINDRLQSALREEDLDRIVMVCTEMVKEAGDTGLRHEKRVLLGMPEEPSSPQLRKPVHTPLVDYLGDGVYADVEQGMIRLTTENGIEVQNEIYLEPSVVEAFERYVERIRQLNK